MKKKFYICGKRPVIREIHNDYEKYFSFQWETGQFEQICNIWKTDILIHQVM